MAVWLTSALLKVTFRSQSYNCPHSHSLLPAFFWLAWHVRASTGLLMFCFAGHSVFPEILASMKRPQDGPKVMNQACLSATLALLRRWWAGGLEVGMFAVRVVVDTNILIRLSYVSVRCTRVFEHLATNALVCRVFQDAYGLTNDCRWMGVAWQTFVITCLLYMFLAVVGYLWLGVTAPEQVCGC